MAQSLHDKIAESITPAVRAIHDIKIDILGKEIYYLRITEGDQDRWGEQTKTYLSGIIDNVILEYPLSEIEMFDQTQNSTTEGDAISLHEILPITMTVKFVGSGVAGVEEGDFIVDYVKDEHGTVCPIKMEVMRQIVGINDRFLISRKWELSLVRGLIEDDIEERIDSYLATV